MDIEASLWLTSTQTLQGVVHRRLAAGADERRDGQLVLSYRLVECQLAIDVVIGGRTHIEVNAFGLIGADGEGAERVGSHVDTIVSLAHKIGQHGNGILRSSEGELGGTPHGHAVVGIEIVEVGQRSGERQSVEQLGHHGLLLLGSILYALVSGNRDSIGRFLTASLTASEFVGRLLYARDAVPVILRHPLGLGYTGFRCLQGSFQTGVYSVQHVHNELLQLLLDAGWVPTGLFLWALWRSLRSREGGICRKMLLAVLLLHCLLDFDTQFVSLALLLFLVLDTEPQAKKRLPFGGIARHFSAGMLTLLALLSLWIGSASFLYYFRKPSAALRIYPAYTAALLDLLPNASEQELGPLADRVLRLNQSAALAHDAKARTEFSSGSFSGMYEHKLAAIRLAKYHMPEYLDYFDTLIYSYQLYQQNGDQASADRCLSLIGEIPGMLEEVDRQTSRLGRMIKEQPELTLPPPYLAWMEKYASGFVSNS